MLVQRGGGEHRGDEARRGDGGGPRGDRGDGVALVRQRRGPAAAGDVLAHLADLGLGQQHEVGGDGADRGAGPPEQARELGDPPALGVPRERGIDEVEPPGQRGAHGPAVAVERGEGADGAAELDRGAPGGERVGGGVQPARTTPRPAART